MLNLKCSVSKTQERSLKAAKVRNDCFLLCVIRVGADITLLREREVDYDSDRNTRKIAEVLVRKVPDDQQVRVRPPGPGSAAVSLSGSFCKKFRSVICVISSHNVSLISVLLFYLLQVRNTLF